MSDDKIIDLNSRRPLPTTPQDVELIQSLVDAIQRLASSPTYNPDNPEFLRVLTLVEFAAETGTIEDPETLHDAWKLMTDGYISSL